MYMYLLAATAEPSRGWGGPAALAIAVAIFGAIVWLKSVYDDKIGNHSPTPSRGGEIADRTLYHGEFDTDDTDADTDQPDPWYGRIVTIGGRRMRVVQHILRTGSSPKPAEIEAGPQGDGLDIITDDDPGEPIEEWIARADGRGMTYSEMVRIGVAHYGLSEATVKRRIRDVRAAGKGLAA